MFEKRSVLDKIANNIALMLGLAYRAEFCHISENATYVVYFKSSPLYTVRISRTNYRTYSQLKSEIDWLLMLEDYNTPVPIKLNDNYINNIDGYFVVMFKYIDGYMPQYNDADVMYNCGMIAAKLHNAPKCVDADRPVWSIDNMVGKNGIWGDWRNNKNLSKKDVEFIEYIIEETRLKISNYNTQKYGLIHFDLRMTNIVVNDKYNAIDFDDCGYGYYIQDLASALSFMEDSPCLEELKMAWFKGYQQLMPLDKADKDIANCFIALRRIQLLAWITSHKDSDYVKSVEKGFAEKTIEVLKKVGL